MNHEKPLWMRLYFEECYSDVARMVGYGGMTFRDFQAGLETLIRKHGRKVEQASWHLVTYEGQNRTNVAPLAKVELRAHVRTLCFQLLGPPPEHPLHGKLTDGPPLHAEADPPADKSAEPNRKPKKRTRKK